LVPNVSVLNEWVNPFPRLRTGPELVTVRLLPVTTPVNVATLVPLFETMTFPVVVKPSMDCVPAVPARVKFELPASIPVVPEPAGLIKLP